MTKDLLDCVGNTPMTELPKTFTKCSGEIYVKLEEYNLGGSIKSRAGKQMILDAEESGILNPASPDNVTIVEPTGGNTGIGIAQICALRGYHCILVIPDNYSKKRIKVLKKLGAEIILSDSTTGNDSHIVKAKQIAHDNPSFYMPDQFSNPSNPKTHYLHTGPEIIRDVGKKIDYFVAGVGTGGTLTGIGRVLKEKNPACQIYAVQPEGCDVLKGVAVPHIIQGIAIGQVPKVLDADLVDGVITVTNDDVINMRNTLAARLGLYLGYSAAANILASQIIAKNNGKNSVIATVAPDGGRNYDD